MPVAPSGRRPCHGRPCHRRASHPATRFAAAVVAAVALGTAAAAPVTRADDSPRTSGGAEVISLEDQLKTGLRVRRPEEGEFVEEVVRLVNTGRLPRKVVESTYLWAVTRRQTYPFPAFERALRLRAEKLGVDF